MRYTSISRRGVGNYQSDFESVKNFNDWCNKSQPTWAHLFDVKTDECVASYKYGATMTDNSKEGGDK